MDNLQNGQLASSTAQVENIDMPPSPATVPLEPSSPDGQPQKNKDKEDERKLTIAEYLVGGFGGFLVGFTELLKSGSESTNVTVLRISAVLREQFSPALSGGWVALCLLAIISMLLCYIYRPGSRKESFALGLSVYAVLTAVTPQQSAPKGKLSSAGPFVHFSIFSTAYAQDLKSGQNGDYYFEFQGRSRTKNERIVMSVFDQTEKRLLTEMEVNPKSVSKLQLPKGEYVLQFECRGCERSRAYLTVEKPVEGAKVTLDDSGIPLSLQRLFRPSFVDIEDLSDKSLDRVITKYKGQLEKELQK